MKRKIFLAATSLSLLTIAACGDTATPTSGVKDESNLTLQEVYNKAIERQQSLESVHAKLEMNQATELSIDGQSVMLTSSSNLTMDMTQNPLSFYTNGTVDMNMGDEKVSMPMEMYMTEKDGFFFYNGQNEQWLKLPESQQELLLQQTGAQADASEQLEQLKPFIEDFTFKQDNDSYLLTLSIEGEKFKEFILSQMNTSLGDLTEVNEEIYTNMSFKDSKYEIVIEKDTFDTKQIDMDLTLLMDIEGQTTKVESDTKVEYSKFDEMDQIKIPDAVKNKAISSDF
ncbi:MAG: DUF6612 family protein [Solibacillus sp.]|jgi:flagellar biosynthesis component FlhA|uniref:DUF6612 family protein n=1 Tax=Solibacillus sp. TaxID=1909654 RepID=UPI003314ECB7